MAVGVAEGVPVDVAVAVAVGVAVAVAVAVGVGLGVPVGVLALTHDIVRNKEGDNDGVVSVESARFGERRENWTFLEIWPGNHFRQINWGTNILLTPSEENDNTIVEKYTALAARLRDLPPLSSR